MVYVSYVEYICLLYVELVKERGIGIVEWKFDYVKVKIFKGDVVVVMDGD